MLLLVIGIAAAALLGFVGRWHWYADLFAHLRPQYSIGLALTLILALVLRQRLAAGIALGAFLINAAALAPHARSWATSPLPASEARSWTFASINLLGGNREPERVVRYLRETQPDIVVFQEVTKRLAHELEALRDVYPHRYVYPATDQWGMALFSREPPTEQFIRTVGNRPADIALFARWSSSQRHFSLAAVHPDKPDEGWKTVNRAQYLDNLAQWVGEVHQRGDAIIVLGDFNATPWSYSMQKFVEQTGLRNANDGRIYGASWNVWQPQRLLIDHALFSEEWRLERCTIGLHLGSDHRPLFVRAALD